MVYNDSFPKIPSLAVGLQDADKLVAIGVQLKTDLSLFISTNAHTLPDTVGYNVIGEWKGSEFPDQYITVGGHLDSWDPAEGAQDDGAGCVHSIEVLRALKAIGYKPKHTIRVVLFTDEENGGRGARNIVQKPKRKMRNIYLHWKAMRVALHPREFSFKGNPEAQICVFMPWLPLYSKAYGVTCIYIAWVPGRCGSVK